jgi:hypothetical protein
MRRILLSLIVAAASLLVMATSTGCDDQIVTSNARSSLSGFLTGMISEAISKSAAD